MATTDVDNNRLPSYGVETVAGSSSSSQVQVVTSGFSLPKYDYVGVTYPTTSQEVYTFKTGGSGGTTVAVITLDYSDAVTKQILTAATRT